MENFEKTILEKWLLIDFTYIAKKLSFIQNDIVVPDKLIYDTIRCLDYETTMKNRPSVNYVITVIALMWEYVNKEKYNLHKIIIKFLSRIGYPTSAIIVDKDFNKNDCVFSNLGSVIEELLVTLNQEHNSIEVKKHKFLLTDFQMDIWESMNTEEVIGISAPTSAGKSFVILLKLLDKMCETNFDIFYIVPTLSLLYQVSEDFKKMLKVLNIKNCKISNFYFDNLEENVNCIYVLTQEKAIPTLADENSKFYKDMVLVADEIQNIERIKEDNDERAKILFDTLNEFRYKSNIKQIIISGPRINDIEQTGKAIFGEETKNITSIDSPVLNLTYSVFKEKDKFYLKQYCSLTQNPSIMEITNSNLIKGYGKNRYDDVYLYYLNNIVQKLRGQQNLIFSPTAPTARKIATHIVGESSSISKMVDLIKYYSETVHPDYSLCKALANGVAYHHGKLPNHVRRTLEVAIQKKWISNVVCTTTLLQGVNLPAQNIIIRNPHLYVKKNATSTELSNYEMANLRGRAGRLLKDFIGRTFVLDESSFLMTEGYEQMSLFDDTTKDLPVGYGERFKSYRDKIENVIFTEMPLNSEMSKYGDLVSYIRQSVLRFGENAVKRMDNVGIQLTKEQVAAIISKLNNISIPKEICYKNRYWDPFVLDSIYKGYTGNVPTHPKEYGAKTKLDKMLKFLRDTDETKGIYEKYIPKYLRSGRKRGILVDLCMLWAKETPLIDILSNKLCSNETDISDQVEETIRVLQNIVSYNIPLLIKPIFDIKNEKSLFVSSLQAGACQKVSKCLIELGVPRECALYLNKNYFGNNKEEEENNGDIVNYVRKKLYNHINEMPFWIKVQVESLI